MECIAREGLAPLPVAASENIVFRAIDALAHEVGRTEPDFLEVRLEKHIPHQAGLGGGSSDAAAALLGMARLWEIGPDDPALERVAHRLGSDVAFFLQGGCACFEGTGERFAHALEPMKRSLVLVRPVKGVSTAEAYRMFDEAPLPIDEGCLQQAKQAACASDVPLFNNLASASERLMPELDEVKAWLQSQPGVEGVLLCGSGSTTFGRGQRRERSMSFDGGCSGAGLVGPLHHVRLAQGRHRAMTVSPKAPRRNRGARR